MTGGPCRPSDTARPSPPRGQGRLAACSGQEATVASHRRAPDRHPGVNVTGRRAATIWLALAAAVLLAIVGALAAARATWFGIGPSAIHDAMALRARIHVCGRDYNRSNQVVSRAGWPREAPFVLVEPAPLAGCSTAVDDPSGFCAANPLACGTWTILLVRIGDDAYEEYSLVGGP